MSIMPSRVEGSEGVCNKERTIMVEFTLEEVVLGCSLTLGAAHMLSMSTLTGPTCVMGGDAEDTADGDDDGVIIPAPKGLLCGV